MKTAQVIFVLLSVLDLFSAAEDKFLIPPYTTSTTEKRAVTGIDGCIEYNTIYKGPHFKSHKINVSPSDCQVVCEATDGCNFWSWDEWTCSMKGERGDRALNTQGNVSGTARCGPLHHCFQKGYGFKDATAHKLGGAVTAASVKDCREACISRSECFFFMFKANTCSLLGKSAISDVEVSADAIIGPKECRTGWCYSRGESFVNSTGAREIRNIVTGELCQRECVQNKDCTMWAHQYPQSCYLFNDQALTQRTKQFSGLTGFKTCGSSGGKCFKEKTKMGGLPLGQTSASSPENCQQDCYNQNKCFFWTYYPENKSCEFRGQDADGTGTPHENAITGPYKCYSEI